MQAIPDGPGFYCVCDGCRLILSKFTWELSRAALFVGMPLE